jgi:hypothetical protein
MEMELGFGEAADEALNFSHRTSVKEMGRAGF